MKNQLVSDKSMLVKAMEVIIANPLSIKNEAIGLMGKFEKEYPAKSKQELRKIVGKKIISNYSSYSALSGGATALPGIVPGVGSVVAVAGGASTDTALFMKFQVEMTMALAVVYGHDILEEEEKRLCWIIAGVSTLTEGGKKGVSKLASNSIVNVVNKYLKNGALTAIKEIFKKIGINFTKKAFVKVIPFGVGVIVGAGLNKTMTICIGKKAVDYFESEVK